MTKDNIEERARVFERLPKEQYLPDHEAYLDTYRSDDGLLEIWIRPLTFGRVEVAAGYAIGSDKGSDGVEIMCDCGSDKNLMLTTISILMVLLWDKEKENPFDDLPRFSDKRPYMFDEGFCKRLYDAYKKECVLMASLTPEK